MRPSALISAMILSLLILTAALSIRQPEDRSATGVSLSNAELLLTTYPGTFLRDITLVDKLSQDGRMIGFLKEGDLWTYDLIALQEKKLDASDQLDWVTGFEWQGSASRISLTGFLDGVEMNRMVTREDGLALELPQTHQDIAANGDQVYAYKYYDPDKQLGGVYLNTPEMEEPELILDDIYPVAMSLSPDGGMLAYLYRKADANLCLSRYIIADRRQEDLLEHLDGSSRSRIGFTPNGQYILISLARLGTEDLKARHQPFADRDLNIYAVDLVSGNVNPVTIEEGDDMLIAVDGDKAYWNISRPMVKTVLVSYEDGKVSPLIAEQSFMPVWHPEGNELAVVYGEWRMADLPLNWDIGKFTLDGNGGVKEALSPLITGYHQDLGISWSPEKPWMVYQSNRSKDPVMFYDGPGSSNGIFLKTAFDGQEISLTEKYRECWKPEFSPDGSRILYCASAIDTFDMRPRIIHLDDQGLVGEIRDLPLDGIGEHVWMGTWTPDGKQLILEVSDGASGKAIWIMDENGGDAVERITFESLVLVSGIDVTPDGREIVYAALDEKGHHQLYRIGLKKGDPVKITDNAYDMILPQVAPDGKRIAATVYRNTKQLWMADLIF